MSDTASGTFNMAGGNGQWLGIGPVGQVSHLDVHNLLYPGAQTKVFVHFQPWFSICNPGAGVYPVPNGAGGYLNCNGHVETGYDASTPIAPVSWQMEDIQARHFDGIVVDWYGPNKNPENTTTANALSTLNSNCTGFQSCPLLMVIMEDQGSWKNGSNPCVSGLNAPDQTQCVLTHLEADMDFLNTHYFNQESYLKVQYSAGLPDPWLITAAGRPVTMFFVDQGSWNVNWTTVWNSLRSYVQSYGANTPLFIFENSSGFTHIDEDGAFAWVNQYKNLTGCDPADPYGLCYLKQFYDTAVQSANSTKLAFGAAWKGFDNTYASWASTKTSMGQRCGQTWLDSMSRGSVDYNSNRQLPFLQVPTWNDYDEGTEIETGIDNCLSISANISNGNLAWSLGFRNIEPGAFVNENTVDHYEIYYGNPSDTTAFYLVATNIPVQTRGVPLSSLNLPSGTINLFVYAAAKSSLTNQISNAVVYTH